MRPERRRRPAKAAVCVDPPPSATDVHRLHGGYDAAGELDAWAAAVVHLHSAGLPAAVPPFPDAWLARRGVRADWVTAA